ncbi:hypothetical protein DNI29_11125 [Hymenobacter sediminis]|uniref:lipocalin family protein n=1 Tax=Hymenobacter sediminis TaxID=2218621 RepID=UPI000DA6A8FF|nr:lipocalin family protein [Hymenobacter sediminis]RPD47975.1 hypothetical protein DNI29_11125 [Hymenobacter sediminis]
MKALPGFALVAASLLSCNPNTAQKESAPTSKAITGTWQLIKSTIIEKGDTTSTDYTKNKKISFVKIINDTHFSFLQHDVNKGKDSAVFVAGGGRYSLTGSAYTEHLEYCSARDWENNDFTFTVAIKNDTLVQRGIEKVEASGINRINIEQYARVK